MSLTIKLEIKHRGIDNRFFITIIDNGKPMFEANISEKNMYEIWKDVNEWEFDPDGEDFEDDEDV